MTFRSNLHTHTVFSDGENTPEEYVAAALGAGLVSLGFSEHAVLDILPEDGITPENIPLYMAEIRRLKKKYAGEIELYLGFESDFIQPADREELDFVIGSVHFIRISGRKELICVDHDTDGFQKGIEVAGSVEKLVGLYYDQLARSAEETRPDILGHLDLVTKMNGGNRFFDTGADWYRKAAAQAVERIAKAGCIVEMNTGGMSRGYMNYPYPAPFILKMLRERKVPMTISSDCHRMEHLCDQFDLCETLLKEVGYRSVMRLQGGRFVEVPL